MLKAVTEVASSRRKLAKLKDCALVALASKYILMSHDFPPSEHSNTELGILLIMVVAVDVNNLIITQDIRPA